VRLYDGDLVQIGSIKMRFFNPTERHAGAAGGEPETVRAPPTNDQAVADLSTTLQSRFHPAVPREAAQRPARLTSDGRAGWREPAWSRTSVYLIVIAAAVMLAVAALVGGFMAR
jgi:hypothetical protein